MKMLLPLALAAGLPSLGACARLPSITTSAPGELARIEQGYATASAVAQLLLPFLPADRAAQIRMIQERIEIALRAARAAATVADQVRALKAARDGTVQLDQAAAPRDWISLAAS